jgi:hypothetical protein
MTRPRTKQAVDAAIARMVAAGCSNCDIADALGMTHTEVRERISLIRLRLFHRRMMPPCRLCQHYRACLHSVIARGPFARPECQPAGLPESFKRLRTKV